MSDNNNKSPLEEALNSYEQIKNFAVDKATENLNEKVSETLKNFFNEKLNEDTTINIDSTGNVEITTDGDMVNGADAPIDMPSDSDDELGDTNMIMPDDATTMGSDDESLEVSDDEDEIEVDDEIEEMIQSQNMEEMNRMMEDEAAAPIAPVADPTAAPVPAADATAAPAPAAPGTETTSVSDLLPKLDTLINLLMQQQGGAAAAPETGAEAGTDQEFEVVDDEAGAMPAAPAMQAPAAVPAMEEEIEITDFEEGSFIDEMENQMIEIDGLPEEDTVDETRGVSFVSKRTGDRALKMDVMDKKSGNHAPVTALGKSGSVKPTMNAKMPTFPVNENKKAQDESKVDELIKENNSLKKEVTTLQNERTKFEESFSKLRTAFHEMQLFNGKLVLVNKVLTNGGLTKEEKIRVCEQFDSAKTPEEAQKLFRSIMKENNSKPVENGVEKLRGNATNTAKSKSTTEPLYESAEARRNRQLAGLGKREEE